MSESLGRTRAPVEPLLREQSAKLRQIGQRNLHAGADSGGSYLEQALFGACSDTRTQIRAQWRDEATFAGPHHDALC